jgi:hypothetical protein
MLPISAAHAIPTDYAFTQVPAHFQTSELTVGSRALGEICYSRLIMPDGTVCNPAYLPYYSDSTLLGRVYIGNGYAAFSTATSFLYSNISKDFLQQLFQQNSTLSLEANAGLVFVTRYFSASFQPYRVQYLSEVHNPNLPVLAVHAALERAFILQGGIPLSMISPSLEGLSFGSNLSILHRRYVHTSFSLFDLATTPTDELIPVKTQLAITFSPTLAWRSFYSGWTFLTSATVTNLGTHTPGDPLYYEPVDFAVGWGVEPPLSFGKLRLGLDLVNIAHGDDFGERIRFGTSYKFGILELMTGVNSDFYSAGLEFAAPIVNVGIAYEFIRKDIEGGSPETKLATEFSFRL